MDRLLIAYQESLVSLEQLRCRIPELRKQDQAVQAELQSLETAAGDQTRYLRLVETLADFHARLQTRAETLDMPERQRVLRLLVKEVLVGRETITIRHSIRIPNPAPDPNGAPRPPHAPQQPPTAQPDPCYLLRSGRRLAVAGEPVFALVRRFVSRSTRAGSKGRCQAGALRRRFRGDGATDGIGEDKVHGVTAGREVPTGDQPGKDAGGGLAGRRSEPELSGIHVSV